MSAHLERVAEAIWRADYPDMRMRTWFDVINKTHYRNLAQAAIDALRFTEEWGVAYAESGLASRPMQIDWARSIRDQCVEAGVAFLFKQWGGRTPKANGRELDGRTWDEYPGGDA